MQYKIFLAAVQWTQAQWNQRGNSKRGPKYDVLRKRGDDYWLHLDYMSKDKLSQHVIRGFLNTPRWFCHLDDPATPRGTQMVSNLHGVLKQLPVLYSSLYNTRIEDLTSGGHEESVLINVTQVYMSFLTIKPKFGRVPASKLMHMALPDLFIMWDDSILEGYGVPREDLPGIERRRRSYAAFLLLMNETISHIRETYPGGLDLTYPQLFDGINKACGYVGLPITRLLDIANFAVRPSPGAPNVKCQRCLRRTNLRLSKLARYTKQYNPGRYK